MIKTILSLLTSILVLIVLLLFDVDFPIVWALLTFLLNFIPNIGSILASLLPILIAVLQFDSFVTVIWLSVCLVGIQFVMGNIIEPKFMGEGVDLSPVLILFALIAWGYLWGFIGMLLAVPLTVLMKIVFENIKSLAPVAKLMTIQKEK